MRLRTGAALSAALSCLFATGCVGFTAQLGYMLWGNNIPAKYPGMEGKRVAVVVESPASVYGPDEEAELLAKLVGATLAQNVKKATILPQDAIADYRDRTDWAPIDPLALGRELKADLVLKIEVGSLSLDEGATLYKGRANLRGAVYDIAAEGAAVDEFDLMEYEFPRNGELPVTGTTRSKFRQTFLGVLAQEMSQRYYAYDFATPVAQDAAAYR